MFISPIPPQLTYHWQEHERTNLSSRPRIAIFPEMYLPPPDVSIEEANQVRHRCRDRHLFNAPNECSGVPRQGFPHSQQSRESSNHTVQNASSTSLTWTFPQGGHPRENSLGQQQKRTATTQSTKPGIAACATIFLRYSYRNQQRVSPEA